MTHHHYILVDDNHPPCILEWWIAAENDEKATIELAKKSLTKHKQTWQTATLIKGDSISLEPTQTELYNSRKQ